MHYRALGRGPTVVLLHGFGMHGGMWIPSILPLASRYRFILPDLPGFGRSHHVPFAHRDVIRSHAEDVQDLLAQLGEPRVRLAGLSMGALTALRVAHDGGFRRVSSYVHIDQAARIHNDASWEHGLFGGEQRERFDEMRTLLADCEPLRDLPYGRLPGALRERIRVAFARFFRTAFQKPLLKAATAAMHRERVATAVLPVTHWGAYLDTMRAYLDERYDFTHVLPEIRIPVTFLVGDASEMYPAEGQLSLARVTPGARAIRFPGAGHALHVEAPLRFLRVLDQALAG